MTWWVCLERKGLGVPTTIFCYTFQKPKHSSSKKNLDARGYYINGNNTLDPDLKMKVQYCYYLKYLKCYFFRNIPNQGGAKWFKPILAVGHPCKLSPLQGCAHSNQVRSPILRMLKVIISLSVTLALPREWKIQFKWNCETKCQHWQYILKCIIGLV